MERTHIQEAVMTPKNSAKKTSQSKNEMKEGEDDAEIRGRDTGDTDDSVDDDEADSARNPQADSPGDDAELEDEEMTRGRNR